MMKEVSKRMNQTGMAWRTYSGEKANKKIKDDVLYFLFFQLKKEA